MPQSNDSLKITPIQLSAANPRKPDGKPRRCNAKAEYMASFDWPGTRAHSTPFESFDDRGEYCIGMGRVQNSAGATRGYGGILIMCLMEFAYRDFNTRPEARHATGGKEGPKERVQCLADLAEMAGAAALDAAFPSGGIKTGTINAERIINTANPTRKSTSVRCKSSFFIRVFLFPPASPLSNSISRFQKAMACRESFNTIRIRRLRIYQGQAV